MIADMISNTKPHSIITELFIRGRILNKQSYFKVPKNLRLKTKHFLITSNHL